MAYVESYDDVAFWSQVLRQWETPDRYFEVMLPSRSSLAKGKKIALSHELGPELIACVDADYDWLMQGSTPTSSSCAKAPTSSTPTPTPSKTCNASPEDCTRCASKPRSTTATCSPSPNS